MFRYNIALVLLVLELVLPLEASLTQKAERWNTYKTRYSKKYQSTAEEANRQAIYESKRQKIEAWNADPSNTYKLSVNKFADQTIEEVVATRTGLKRRQSSTTTASTASSSGNLVASSKPLTAVLASSYPTYMSWAGTSLVSSVKDQGNCGCCWAFAVAGAMEGQSVKAFGKMILPSEQQLVDCDTDDSGCDGGSFETAYGYMSGGMQNTSTYPFKSGSSGTSYTCTASSSKYVVYTKQSTFSYDDETNYKSLIYGRDYGAFVAVPDTNGDLSSAYLNQTIAALNDIGPLSIGVCVEDLFDSYASGVYTNNGSRCTDNNINHAILLVGYNRSSSNANENYWIAKNQWGTDWGIDGYIYMKMGIGLIRESMYPVLKVSSTTTAKTTTKTTTAKTTTKSTTAKTTTKSTTAKTTTKSTTAKTTTKTTTAKTTTKSTTAKTTTKTTTAKTTTKTTTAKTTTKTTTAKTTTKTTTAKTTTKTTTAKTSTKSKTTTVKTTTKTSKTTATTARQG